MNIDIIIPIFNALEDLQVCLKSLYRHTDLRHNRLILINDNSTDERIKPYLDKQISENIIVIHNLTNKGFSNNINLGMEQSPYNDVILLNSDTAVTPRWLEKMSACAYSDRAIGTVTPLSNNATLCSVPEFCKVNSRPEEMSLEEAAQIVEDCSLRKYPRITVANGFCMLIKRELINLIGNFDAETFGRGYGEENDFCNRAEQMGYIHVMCDDTYVFHTGTKSFLTREKEDYINRHDKILKERYPEQMLKNAIYCRDNPNSWVGKNIEYHFALWNSRVNVLYLLQSDFRDNANDNIGGTQLHVKHLTMTLRKSMNIFVAARDGEYLQVTAYTQNRTFPFSFYIGEKELFPVLHSRKLGSLFEKILAGFHIDLVHVHHTAGTSLDVFYEADKLNIPVIFTAHDFYSLCPSVKMLDLNGNVCINNGDPPCQDCLKNKIGLYKQDTYIQKWRQEYNDVLNKCLKIVVPSESTKAILSDYFSNLKGKIQIIEHGIDTSVALQLNEDELHETDSIVWEIEKVDLHGRCPFISGTAYFLDEPNARHRILLKITDCRNKSIFLPVYIGMNNDVLQSVNRFDAYIPNSILNNGKLSITAIINKNNKYYVNKKITKTINVSFEQSTAFKVAFIGGLNEEKGGKIAAEIIKDGPLDVDWYVMGGIGEENLFRLTKKNLVKTGYYHQEDLSCHLKYNGINAICILSRWPETFSYTLSEAVINHIPVIVTAVGALEERVKSNEFGSIVPLGEHTASDVISVINSWKNMGTDYTNMLNGCVKYRHRTIQDMIQDYKLIYDKAGKPSVYAPLSTSDLETLCQAYMNGARGDNNNVDLLSQVNILKNKLNIIENSLTYRIVLKLTSAKIPFRNQLKSLLNKRHNLV